MWVFFGSKLWKTFIHTFNAPTATSRSLLRQLRTSISVSVSVCQQWRTVPGRIISQASDWFHWSLGGPTASTVFSSGQQGSRSLWVKSELWSPAEDQHKNSHRTFFVLVFTYSSQQKETASKELEVILMKSSQSHLFPVTSHPSRCLQTQPGCFQKTWENCTPSSPKAAHTFVFIHIYAEPASKQGSPQCITTCRSSPYQFFWTHSSPGVGIGLWATKDSTLWQKGADVCSVLVIHLKK